MHGDGRGDAVGAALQAAWSIAATAALAASPGIAIADAARGRGLRPLLERLGWAPAIGGGPAWLHAASVGEVRAASPLVDGLAAARADLPVVLSVTTHAGVSCARDVRGLAAPPFHPPADAPACVRRALARVEPRALVTIETEIWPTLFAACARRGIPVAIANARVSQRALARYELVAPLVRRALAAVAVAGARTGEDAARLERLGLPAERIQVTGNLKFDAARATGASVPPWAVAAGLGRGPWIAFASTAEGEEEVLLEAFRALRERRPELRLLLAPRRPERFDEVAGMVASRGMPLVRRSRPGQAVPPGGILLLDSVGELARLYSGMEAVFVGGSLVPHGGQNLLEPAAAGCPVLFGPHVENFRDAEDALMSEGGGRRVDARDLAVVLSELLGDASRRRTMGEAARRAVTANAGATERTLALLAPLLQAARPGGRT